MKTIRSMGLVLLTGLLLGFLLLWAAYGIPTDSWQEQMTASADIIRREGAYPTVYEGCTSMLDNYTDALMLLTAGNVSEEPALMQAMRNSRVTYPWTELPSDDIVYKYIDQSPEETVEDYSRYWHGYLTVLKPLLAMTDYGTIRVINLVGQLAAVLLVVAAMLRAKLSKYILPMLLGVGFLIPGCLFRSLQFSSCFYVMMLGSALVLWKWELPTQKRMLLLLGIGMATSYFDLLTYPTVTLGVPLTLYLCMKQEKPALSALKEELGLSIAWGVGYAGMWAGKWLLSSLITGTNILADAGKSISERTAMQDSQILMTIRVALGENIRGFLNGPVWVVMACFLLGCFVLALVNRVALKKAAVSVIPFVYVAAIPLVWYVVTSNHSSIHNFFTNKSLLSAAFAVMCACVKASTQKVEKESVHNA